MRCAKCVSGLAKRQGLSFRVGLTRRTVGDSLAVHADTLPGDGHAVAGNGYNFLDHIALTARAEPGTDVAAQEPFGNRLHLWGTSDDQCAFMCRLAGQPIKPLGIAAGGVDPRPQ